MRATLRLFSLLLLGATLEFSLAAAPANAASPTACAALAQGIAPRAFMAAHLGVDRFHLLLMVQQNLYGRCLLSQGGAAPSAATSAGNFVTFDVGRGPFPTEINPAGEIAGDYADSNVFSHSFLRTPDGAIATFDPPGAACSVLETACSKAVGVTPNGTIAGSYNDASRMSHGFLRTPDGAFTVFDAPGSTSTEPSAINPEGTVTGNYFTAGGVLDFVRSRFGVFASFSVPGLLCAPAAINPAGTITGFCGSPVSFGLHAYVRDRDGVLTQFAPAGSVSTEPTAINPNGAVTGFYQDASFAGHGFLRAPDGAVTTFDAPGLNAGTFPTGITPSGAIVGYDILADFSAVHGFLRAPSGAFTIFDPPGSILTFPRAISATGEITGAYLDENFLGHGFVGIP
jgi:hypothetical protein